MIIKCRVLGEVVTTPKLAAHNQTLLLLLLLLISLSNSHRCSLHLPMRARKIPPPWFAYALRGHPSPAMATPQRHTGRAACQVPVSTTGGPARDYGKPGRYSQSALRSNVLSGSFCAWHPIGRGSKGKGKGKAKQSKAKAKASKGKQS